VKRSLIIVLLFIFSCNVGHGLKPESSEKTGKTGISGTITFIGNWHPDTYEVRIAVLKKYPPESMFHISAFSDPIPEEVYTYEYILELQPGTYKGVVVAWRSLEIIFDPDYVLGFYKESPQDSLPAQVTVKEGELTKNIDITADFGIIGKIVLTQSILK